jgi:DNA polymerase-3 subunit alpha/error-prone DNA polymerase
MRAVGRDESVLTKHNFDKTPLPLEAPAFESVIIIYAFAKAPSVLKLMSILVFDLKK